MGFSSFADSMKKVALYTLGCKLNFTETSTIADGFKAEGFSLVDFTENPDVFVINTCSVTENADKKCRKIVKEAKTISPRSEVYIIGCYAQLKPDEIRAIPGVTEVYGAKEKFEIIDHVHSKRKANQDSTLKSLEFIPSYSSDHRTRLFFKVQDGCNYGCTFCTIPLARGKSRSINSDELLKLAQESVKKFDSREIILTGVNIGDFGIIDGKRQEKFIDLVKKFEDSLEVPRIRISSIEPNLLSEDIIGLVAKSKKIVPHFHVPLQSGSNLILSKMKRRYKRELYQDRVESIKSLIPDAAIGVDVIVGFPGEGIQEFMETYEFLESLDVSYFHVFPYSERPNTLAKEMEGSVTPKERNRRANDLRKLSDQKRTILYSKNIGTTRKVLFEQKVKGGKMYGFTENYIKVSAPYDPEHINEIKPLILSGIGDDLVCTGKEVPLPSVFI